MSQKLEKMQLDVEVSPLVFFKHVHNLIVAGQIMNLVGSMLIATVFSMK